MKFAKTLKKTRRTQFFDNFECFDNKLIINILQAYLSFLPQNTVSNPLTFKFLFRHTFKIANYTLLNILSEAHSLFLRFPMFFQKLYAENFSKLLSF